MSTSKIQNRIQKVKSETNVLETLKKDAAKSSTWRPSILVLSNAIAKQEYSFSQFWNKVQKDRNDCYISLAFCKLCERETLRPIQDIKEIPYTVLVNHFLPVFNAAKKYPLNVQKCTWYTFSLFLSYVANMKDEQYYTILNFGLKHKISEVK